MDELIKRGTKRAILIVDGKSSNSKFHPSSENKYSYTAQDLEKHFKKNGLKYEKKIVEMQFGYPFKDLKEIYAFLGQYYQDEQLIKAEADDIAMDSDRLFASAEERIIKTNRFDFPYYLPKSVSIGIFIISC